MARACFWDALAALPCRWVHRVAPATTHPQQSTHRSSEAKALSSRRCDTCTDHRPPSVARSMAKHKGQKAKNKSKKAKKAQIPLGPGGTLSKKQKMKQNKVIVTSYLQQKKAHGADYKKMRAHGNKKEWKKFAEEVKKAWNGTPETLFFLQNSMNAREVFMAVFKVGASHRRRGSPRRRLWLRQSPRRRQRPGRAVAAAAPCGAGRRRGTTPSPGQPCCNPAPRTANHPTAPSPPSLVPSDR